MEIINWRIASNPVNYVIVLLMVILGAFLVDALLTISARAGSLPMTTSQVQGQNS